MTGASSNVIAAWLLTIHHVFIFYLAKKVRECLLLFGPESVVFQVAIQKLKDQNI